MSAKRDDLSIYPLRYVEYIESHVLRETGSEWRDTANGAMNRARSRIERARIGAMFLALTAALIHLYLFLAEGFPGSGSILAIYQLLFVGNFLAYSGLAVALYLPAFGRYHRLVRVLLVAVAVTSFASYLYVGVFDLLGTLDKLVEILLLALLAVNAGILGHDVRDAALQLTVGTAAGLLLFLILTPVMV
jgi:hypothetical protein